MPQGANRKLGDIALASLRAAESGRNLRFLPAAISSRIPPCGSGEKTPFYSWLYDFRMKG